VINCLFFKIPERKLEYVWIDYDDSGRVFSYNTYVNDNLTGESIDYFVDGAISFYDKEKIAEKGSFKANHFS